MTCTGFRLAAALAVLLILSGGKLCAADKQPIPADHAARVKEGLKLFKQHVRSALVKHCLECHGGQATKGDFDLSTRKALFESGMIDKTAEDSYLISLITHAEEPHMPFKKPKLPAETIAHIARWIDLEAPYDKPLAEKQAGAPTAMQVTDADRRFWSFLPLNATDPPAVKEEDWCRTAVDRFILTKLQAKGLRPNAVASRRTLVRRAYFDLLGLPPEPQAVEAFVNDPDPKAYEKLIDRLLDSPHYGERWARHWMDVARFAESHGYEQDYDRPHAYHYRDFLIKALNADLPYDQFVSWQLAGDELAPDDPLAMTATGFLGAGVFPTQLTEAEFESARYDELDDMVATTGVAFLGLSIGCARCHDHKFDPIPTRDYYRLASSFTTTIRSEIELQLQPEAEPQQVMVSSEGFPHMKHHADGRGFPHFYPQTHFLTRGDVHQKGPEATQGFLQVLMRGGKNESHWRIDPPEDWTRTRFTRATLARWITDTEYGAGHLAARVIVNRLWQHHFGRGIVATPNDFGFQGERPTLPELLDWLADELIQSGWKLKRLHKLMMTSAVYMQNGDFDEDRARIDRENLLHWRRAPRRLEAEVIRDAMLSVSGLLDKTMYGLGTLDPNMRRRSVYFFIKRSQLIPMLMLFDWPEHLVSIGRRATTTTAPQALLFMNSPQGRQYAQAFAERLGDVAADDVAERSYRIAFGRPPNQRERQFAGQFLEKQIEVYQQAGKSNADSLARVDFCQAVMSMNEFVYVE